jgi:hypothetical protein
MRVCVHVFTSPSLEFAFGEFQSASRARKRKRVRATDREREKEGRGRDQRIVQSGTKERE